MSKIKHSIADKIVFLLLCTGSLITLIWNIYKDFIPEQYSQLKLLIMILGALSAFFAFLSFYWDRKFDTVTKDIEKVQNDIIQPLDKKVQVFLDGDFNYYQSFTDAIASIFDKQKAYFKTIKIFAYSAKNYIHYFQTSNMKVENLKLCLHRANDYSAWFMNSITHVQKYQNELKIVLENLETLKENGKIDSYEVKFYNFDSYSHFGIFDNQIMFGELLPFFSEKKTVSIGSIQTLSNVGLNKDFFENKDRFFNELFNCSVYDSGLKRFKKGCNFCETTELMLDPRHRKGSAIRFGKCDISLLENVNTIEDFLIGPDLHPISELHMLFVSKFHILNLHEYLFHKDSIQNMTILFNIIRNVIFKKTGREIIIFEHGSATEHSELTASSVDHLHIHIIYKPKNIDYIAKIENENIIDIASNKNCEINYNSIEDFANDSILKNKDYIMLFTPGEKIKDNRISVWLPQKKESQFLRRIFYQCLSHDEKESLYGTAQEFEYDWKKYDFQYTDEKLDFLKDIGKGIQEEFEKWKKLKN